MLGRREPKKGVLTLQISFDDGTHEILRIPRSKDQAITDLLLTAGANLGSGGGIGPAGKSAYQVWLDAGNTGSIDTFLASLQGPKGDKGDPGTGGTGSGAPSGSYTVELSRWGISNDGTNPAATSAGINNALVWAAANGYMYVTLPKGTYLIDVNNPIQPQSFQTLDLGGATLRIQQGTNLPKYRVVSFSQDQVFSRVTNGIIMGDRLNRDYTEITSGEGGFGIGIGDFTPTGGYGSQVRFITVDNLEIYDCSGDSIALASVYGQVWFDGSNKESLTSADFTSGSIDINTGTDVSDASRIRTTINIKVNQPDIIRYGSFGFYGGSQGGLGDITTDMYDVFFYKADNTYISGLKNCHFFDELSYPAGTEYCKLVLHTPTIPVSPAMTIRATQIPKYITIEKCKLHHTRRCSISVTGCKFVHIRNNRMYEVRSGYAQGLIDIEDGFNVNQNIYIEGNDFSDSEQVVNITTGRNIYINKNKFTNVGLMCKIFANNLHVNENTFINSPVTFASEGIFEANTLINSNLTTQEGVDEHAHYGIIRNSLFKNCAATLLKSAPFMVTMDGCDFYFDSDSLVSPNIGIGCPDASQTVKNCNLYNCSLGGFTEERFVFQNVNVYGGGSGLPPGDYQNCHFIRPIAPMAMVNRANGQYTFTGCYFEISDVDLFGYPDAFDAITKEWYFKDCRFVALTNNKAFYLGKVGCAVEIIDCKFDWTAASSTSVRIIEFGFGFFTGPSITVRGCTFKANVALYALDTSSVPAGASVLFKDNYVSTASLANMRAGDTKINNMINGTFTA